MMSAETDQPHSIKELVVERHPHTRRVTDSPRTFRTERRGMSQLRINPTLDYRRFAHFPPNLLKSLDRGFAKLASSPLQIIEHKGLIEMTEPRVTYLNT